MPYLKQHLSFKEMHHFAALNRDFLYSQVNLQERKGFPVENTLNNFAYEQMRTSGGEKLKLFECQHVVHFYKKKYFIGNWLSPQNNDSLSGWLHFCSLKMRMILFLGTVCLSLLELPVLVVLPMCPTSYLT